MNSPTSARRRRNSSAPRWNWTWSWPSRDSPVISTARCPTSTATGSTSSAGARRSSTWSFSAVEPVDYGVSGVALLSGVNSGGKTSTLDLVALVVILAHMGLPVPAESVRLRRFEELHYHGKTQGTLDAGAFESTLRQFASLADGQTGRLVLVDELESITEPGASAKIIAGILEELGERDVTGVFVSHLADEIRAVARLRRGGRWNRGEGVGRWGTRRGTLAGQGPSRPFDAGTHRGETGRRGRKRLLRTTAGEVRLGFRQPELLLVSTPSPFVPRNGGRIHYGTRVRMHTTRL